MRGVHDAKAAVHYLVDEVTTNIFNISHIHPETDDFKARASFQEQKKDWEQLLLVRTATTEVGTFYNGIMATTRAETPVQAPAEMALLPFKEAVEQRTEVRRSVEHVSRELHSTC